MNMSGASSKKSRQKISSSSSPALLTITCFANSRTFFLKRVIEQNLAEIPQETVLAVILVPTDIGAAAQDQAYTAKSPERAFPDGRRFALSSKACERCRHAKRHRHIFPKSTGRYRQLDRDVPPNKVFNCVV